MDCDIINDSKEVIPMGFMDKVKDFVAPIEDEDEGYEATEKVQPVVEEPMKGQKVVLMHQH